MYKFLFKFNNYFVYTSYYVLSISISIGIKMTANLTKGFFNIFIFNHATIWNLFCSLKYFLIIYFLYMKRTLQRPSHNTIAYTSLEFVKGLLIQ